MLIAPIISRDLKTIRVSPKAGIVSRGVMERLRAIEMAQARSVTATISLRTGEIMSLRGIRPIGIAIGTVGATIGGMAIIAVSSTAPG